MLGMGLHHDEVRHHDHIAFFWEDQKQFRQAVGFLETGLRGHDHCVVFGHAYANRQVLGILKRLGFDPSRLKREGRLSVLGPENTGDKTLAQIGGVFQTAVERGAPLIRLLGNIGWGKQGWPKKNDIMAFEAKVTGACRQFPSVVVCMYDVASLPGDVILKGAFETHPVIIRGNVVRVNPCWIPAEEFIAQLCEGKSRRASARPA